MVGRLKPLKSKSQQILLGLEFSVAFCSFSVVHFAIIIYIAKLFHSSTGKSVRYLYLATETHSRLNLVALHSSITEQPRGTEAALPGYLGERGEPAAPFGKGQGRTNAGACHLYGRPLNGIPVWMEGLEVKSLLWVPSSASHYWTEYKYSCTWLQTTENLSLQNFKDLWLLNLLPSKKNNTCCHLLSMLSLPLGVFEDGK